MGETLSTVLSTKGQVIVPKAVRERQGWRPGARLTVEETADGVLLRAAPAFPASRMDQVFGRLRRPGQKPVSIEEMNEAVVAEARRRARD